MKDRRSHDMPDPELPRIVAIGDSLIYGRLDGVHGGWVGRLRRWLETEGPFMTAVFNLGIGGQTSADVLERIAEECGPRTPNIIVIGVGTNDLRRPVEPNAPCEVALQDFGENLERLARVAASMGARTALAGLVPVDEARTQPHNGFFYFNSDVEQYDGVVREVSRRESADYVPFGDAFRPDATRGMSLRDSDLIADGIHPSEDGHAAMFDVAQRFFTGLLSANFGTS
jgi:lysophospholipase L1-like esterase